MSTHCCRFRASDTGLHPLQSVCFRPALHTTFACSQPMAFSMDAGIRAAGLVAAPVGAARELPTLMLHLDCWCPSIIHEYMKRR